MVHAAARSGDLDLLKFACSEEGCDVHALAVRLPAHADDLLP